MPTYPEKMQSQFDSQHQPLGPNVTQAPTTCAGFFVLILWGQGGSMIPLIGS